MKTKAYILGVIYLALLILGLVQIGINAPQGPPPYDYQMAEDEAKRVNVNVDNYTISRITVQKNCGFAICQMFRLLWQYRLLTTLTNAVLNIQKIWCR